MSSLTPSTGIDHDDFDYSLLLPALVPGDHITQTSLTSSLKNGTNGQRKVRGVWVKTWTRRVVTSSSISDFSSGDRRQNGIDHISYVLDTGTTHAAVSDLNSLPFMHPGIQGIQANAHPYQLVIEESMDDPTFRNPTKPNQSTNLSLKWPGFNVDPPAHFRHIPWRIGNNGKRCYPTGSLGKRGLRRSTNIEGRYECWGEGELRKVDKEREEIMKNLKKMIRKATKKNRRMDKKLEKAEQMLRKIGLSTYG
ncbi:hypothetical protein IQ07DRAFT_606476 [Pyrenochaeta sp. DS3sAY3a]|nr:hypothetical protein IQ07DRAFT_606476 [Pyrenochaeta sp. DS3sAY3a]